MTVKKLFVILTFGLFTTICIAQKYAYRIYNSNGKKVSYNKMIKALDKSDIILFGELHNNAIAHWLQLEVTKDLNENNTLILGAEMLEADNQLQLNDFLASKLDYNGLDSTARLWPNYKTDYAPLVNFAKENQVKFIATNVPRRYARMVNKGGFEALDTLSNKEKTWIAPLPIPFDSELQTYKNILKMMGDHGTPTLVMAQAIKDATMAHFILENYKSGLTFIHYNGAYHSDNYEGILWYLQRKQPSLTYRTISTVSQENINSLEDEYKNKADFIICVDSDMTTTY